MSNLQKPEVKVKSEPEQELKVVEYELEHPESKADVIQQNEFKDESPVVEL